MTEMYKMSIFNVNDSKIIIIESLLAYLLSIHIQFHIRITIAWLVRAINRVQNCGY